jgi:hypothetical protein
MAAVAVAALLTGALAGCGSEGGDLPASQPVVPLGPQGLVAQFVVECRFSHAAPDDPIVHPGEAGASHLHQFFGATGTGASSTADDLRGGDTTCQDHADTASYWAPALYRDGQVVDPTRLDAYYRPGPDVDPTTVEALPAGLMIVSGDHLAESPQPLSVAGWHCGSSPRLSSEPPTCTEHAQLALRVTFPDCWDGERVDSDDHRSHMARSADGRCPRAHPVPVTQLVVDIHYPVWGPADLALASGTPLTAHADFLNSWDQAALEREVRSCINRDLVCGVVSNRATG